MALIASNGKETAHEYEIGVGGSQIRLRLEVLQLRNEAVDLLLQAQPADETDIDAISVPRAPGQRGVYSDDELGIVSTNFWIDRK